MPKLLLNGSKLEPYHLGNKSYSGLDYSVTLVNNEWTPVDLDVYPKLQQHDGYQRDLGQGAIDIDDSGDAKTTSLLPNTVENPDPSEIRTQDTVQPEGTETDETSPADLSAMNAEESIQLIKQTNDIELLRQWYAAETRTTVKSAITNRINTLNQ